MSITQIGVVITEKKKNLEVDVVDGLKPLRKNAAVPHGSRRPEKQLLGDKEGGVNTKAVWKRTQAKKTRAARENEEEKWPFHARNNVNLIAKAEHHE